MIVSSMYYGSKRIVAVYLGTELIYRWGCYINGQLEAELDMQGNVVALRVVPISPETDLTLGIEAATNIRPSAALSADAEFGFSITPKEVYTPEAARVDQAEDGLSFGIEADIFVYNKADMVITDGVSFKMEVIPTTRTVAPVGVPEAEFGLGLEAEAYVPKALAVTSKPTLSIYVDGNVTNPTAVTIAAEPTPVLAVEPNVQSMTATSINTEPEVNLSIEAIVTVLPVAAVTAELNVELDNDTYVHDDALDWIYPEETENYLYIRQVCNIVDDKS